jgi:hypothetical protein
MLEEIRKAMSKLGVGLALAMLACTLAPAQDVTTNSMPGTDFTEYHTYKWVPIDGAVVPNQIVDAQIKQSISQLAAKGLTKTDSDKADLYRLSDLRHAGKTMERLRYGRYALGWRDGLGPTIHDQHRHSGSRYVRSLRQTTCLDRTCNQDPRCQRQSGQEAKESRQGHAEAVEEFSAQSQLVAVRS